MPRDAIRRLMESREVTLAEALQLEDDPPPEMSDRQKRNLAAFTAQYRQAIRNSQIERYKASVEQAKKAEAQAEERLNDARRRIAKVSHDVKHDRIDPVAAEKELSLLRRVIHEQNAVLDSIEHGNAAAEEMVNQDPAQYQHDLGNRFPTVYGGRVRLSVDYLNGDEPSPFLVQR